MSKKKRCRKGWAHAQRLLVPGIRVRGREVTLAKPSRCTMFEQLADLDLPEPDVVQRLHQVLEYGEVHDD